MLRIRMTTLQTYNSKCKSRDNSSYETLLASGHLDKSASTGGELDTLAP